jgi:hypothetical protein
VTKHATLRWALSWVPNVAPGRQSNANKTNEEMTKEILGRFIEHEELPWRGSSQADRGIIHTQPNSWSEAIIPKEDVICCFRCLETVKTRDRRERVLSLLAARRCNTTGRIEMAACEVVELSTSVKTTTARIAMAMNSVV